MLKVEYSNSVPVINLFFSTFKYRQKGILVPVYVIHVAIYVTFFSSWIFSLELHIPPHGILQLT